jgi:fibronectin type 3 domain-containing protein
VPFAIASIVGVLVAGAAAGPSAADTSAPTQPGPVTVYGVTSSSANLTWGTSTDDVKVEGYRVYRGPASAPNSSLSLIATTDAVTSYTATTLYAGTAYKFGIVAIDPSDNASAMTTTTFTTSSSSNTTPPVAPSSSSVSGTAFSSSRIDVVWGASSSSDVAGYLVLRNGTQVGRVDLPGGLHYSDTGLAASTNYTYSVEAVDSAGNVSSATSGRKVKTLAAGTVKIARGPYLANVTANSAVVSWWTNIATSGTVNYGIASTSEHSVNDPTGTVQHHQVTLTGLSGGTTYKYSVVSGPVSSGASFTTAAAPGTTFSFAAIGDFGGGSGGETQNANNIAGAGTSFIQTLGDNIYPSAGLPDPNFATTYSDFDARFFKQFGTAVKSQPFFPANGNKEYYGDGEFWNAFPMLGTNHAWYSYDWGNAHILVVDSEQQFTPGTPQYSFIQNDLATHQSATWRIVAIQRPPYSSSSASSSSLPVQQYLVPLFEQYNVQLVLSGNSHNYERSYPLRGGNVVSSGGVTYVVSGAGGNGFNSFTIAQPSWSAFREASYFEYTKVTVSPTSLRVDAVRADTNAVFDSTTIQASSSDTTPPTAPTMLTATAVSGTRVDLSWSPSTDDVGVTGYQIWRGPHGGTLTQIGSTSGTGTTYSDTTAVGTTSYDYQVTAFDAAGNVSGPSNTATVTTPDGQPPTQPGNFHLTGTTQTSIAVAWDASTDNVGVAGYNVYVGTGPANPTTNTTYTATGLNCGTTYALAVEAYDAAGNKSTQATLSASTAACPDTQPPSAPTNLSATVVNSSQVNLSWTASTDNVGVTAYEIWRGPSGGTLSKIATTPGTATTYQDTSVAASTSYDYEVFATDAANNLSDPSNKVTAATPASVGIAFVGQQNFSGTTGSPAAALAYTGGTGGDFYVLIVATSLGATGNITAVTDSGGNTWTRSTQLGVSGGTNTFLSIWRTTTMVAPPGTITVTGIGANVWDAKVVEFSGVGAADAPAAAQANATASTSLSTPSTTTANAGSLLIAAGVTPGSKTGDPAGWTPLSDVTAQTPHIFSAYELPGAAGPFSATWTISSAKSTGGIASFLPA